MKRRGTPALVEDLEGGEFVRLDLGLARITHRSYGRDRWVRLLDNELRELPGTGVWVGARTRVLEVLQPPGAQRAGVGGDEVDPLLSCPRR